MNKNTAVAATTATLAIPDDITIEWLNKHFVAETTGNYIALFSCFGPEPSRKYLQEAIDEGKVVESPTCAVLTPAAKKPKSIKSKAKKMLGVKGE